MRSELENSGIRLAVGDCSVTECRQWHRPYQTGKTVHVHAKHYKHNEDGRTAPDVCSNGFVRLSHSWNIFTRIGIHTITLPKLSSSASHLKYEPHGYFKDYTISISDPLSFTDLVSFKFSKQTLPMFRRQTKISCCLIYHKTYREGYRLKFPLRDYSVSVYLELYMVHIPYFFGCKTEVFSFQNNPKDLDLS